MKYELMASMMCANYGNLEKEVRDLEQAGIDSFHIDIMDGRYVPNFAMSLNDMQYIRSATKLPLDVHLMIEHPKTQIKFFAEAGADIITVHYKACKKISDTYLEETLRLIKSYGVKCGAVVNPDVPVENIFPVFPLCDMVLLMSVYPGYGGQKFIEEVLEKVKKARAYAIQIGRGDMDIEIDGGVTADNAAKIRAAGVNVLVAGSAVFKAENMAAAISAIRQ